MGVMIGIAVAMGLAILPFATLAGLVSLAVLVWTWGRIGRYFINFGRWIGHWRNFIPLSILGTIHIVVLLLLTFLILPQLKILWIILLVLHLIFTSVCLDFAIIAWTIWFCQWFWPAYRRFLWGRLSWLFGQPQRGKTRQAGGKVGDRSKPITRPPTDRQPPVGSQPPKKRSMLGSLWALMLGKSTKPTRAEPMPSSGPEPGTQPPKKRAPVKRSWFGTLWALMLDFNKPESRQEGETQKKRNLGKHSRQRNVCGRTSLLGDGVGNPEDT
jgi:hypothetical protein